MNAIHKKRLYASADYRLSIDGYGQFAETKPA
jgi:hypothetical protein